MNILWGLLISLSAQAYIPEYSLIASRAADQHGRYGHTYQIQQDVTYHKDAESYTVRETWTVNGENNQRVTIEGRGPLKGLVQGTWIYDGSLKSFYDGTQAKNQRMGDEWLEPLFQFRNSKYFRSRLVNLKVTPPESLRDRPPLSSSTEAPIRYEPSGFLRLARVGGTVAWAIGVPPRVGVAPSVWIEQDQFVLRKYRSANQVVLKADNYVKRDETYWYPSQITYEFGGSTVTINTVSVKPLGKLGKNDTRFKLSSLKPDRDSVKLPDANGLREFYSRFR
jgi:hypothetical protein